MEAHYAISFYFNSINNTLPSKTVFPTTIDPRWKLIKEKLQNMICEYRSILHVYATPWSSIKQTPQIIFSTKESERLSSFILDFQSVTIAQLLSEWMQKISNVMINIKPKLH